MHGLDSLLVGSGDVPQALAKRVHRPLECLAFGLPLVLAELGPAHLVEGVLGEALHVKTIEDDVGLRGVFPHRALVGGRHVDGDRLQRGNALGAQILEELAQRGGVLAGLRPHHVAGLVVDHHREVLVVLAVGDLVDTEVLKSRKPVGRTPALRHPLGDASHRSPRDAHHARDHRLVAALREQRRQVFERPRESSRARLRPGHQLCPDPATLAVHPPGSVAKEGLHAPEIEVTPQPLVGVVVDPSRPSIAAPTARNASGGLHVENQRDRGEREGRDHGVLETEDLAKYGGGAHGGVAFGEGCRNPHRRPAVMRTSSRHPRTPRSRLSPPRIIDSIEGASAQATPTDLSGEPRMSPKSKRDSRYICAACRVS